MTPIRGPMPGHKATGGGALKPPHGSLKGLPHFNPMKPTAANKSKIAAMLVSMGGQKTPSTKPDATKAAWAKRPHARRAALAGDLLGDETF